MIDVTHQINAVRRQVGNRTLESGEARVVTISQVYSAGIDDLWDACTNVERLPRWFSPVSGDLRLGGKYQVEGNAGGTVEQCDPPKFFSATWEFAGAVSWIEVRISPEADGSRFELSHIAKVDEHWENFGPGAVGIGWDMALVGLYLHLSTGESVDREAAMGWFMSPEGMRLLTASSAAWREADIAGGADRKTATEAADRCLKAFTTAPDEAPASDEVPPGS